MSNKVVCVIPARLKSSRFPRKMLADLGDKPLVQWAYEAAKNCPVFDEVVVAVDSKEIFDVVQDFGGEPIMTSVDCLTGTDRLIELQKRKELAGDIWVNWQGDEPFITEEVIAQLLQSIDEEEEEIWTLKRKIDKIEEIDSPHVVKVVCDHSGKALYFSRSSIPYQGNFFKHVGLYAYRASALEKIGGMQPCSIEKAENLEQLRFLYHGMKIRVHETQKEIFGIDTKEELAIAQTICYT